MTPTDRMFAAARETAEAVARREMERDLAWNAWIEQALELAGGTRHGDKG